jgi:hypothetical protein
MAKLIPKVPDSDYRYYEATFRRMERDIAQVVNAFPAEITLRVPKQEMKASTWVINFRCACQAFVHPLCEWKSTHVTAEAVVGMYDDGISFSIDHRENTVTIVPTRARAFDPSECAITINGAVDVKDNEPRLRALLLLKNDEIIVTAVMVANFDPELLPAVERDYPNVHISLRPDNSATIF